MLLQNVRKSVGSFGHNQAQVFVTCRYHYLYNFFAELFILDKAIIYLYQDMNLIC